MEIYEVICYVNKEVNNRCFYINLETAIGYANFCEDRGYVCEIHKYDYHNTLRRDFWRNAKTDDSTEISV